MLITNSIETYKKLRIEYGVPLFFRIQKRELSRDDEAGATTLSVKANKLVSFLGVSAFQALFSLSYTLASSWAFGPSLNVN